MKGPRKREASQPAYDLSFLRVPRVPWKMELGGGIFLVCPYMFLGFKQMCWKIYTPISAPYFDGKWGQICWKVYTSISALDFDGKWGQMCWTVYTSI